MNTRNNLQMLSKKDLNNNNFFVFISTLKKIVGIIPSTLVSLENLIGLYDFINIKLDKAGGLTEAVNLLNTAKKNGFKIMLGCMVGTSLAMAPALLLSNLCDIVDLDGPLFLKQDRKNHIEYKDFLAFPISKRLWGY